jgi:hypothetical protein
MRSRSMKITETTLPGVLVFTPKIYSDSRGVFLETYNERTMQQAGLPTTWRQDNLSVSVKNVIRGIHYQVLQPQGKFVRVAYGAVLDVAVDLRRSSPTFVFIRQSSFPKRMERCSGFLPVLGMDSPFSPKGRDFRTKLRTITRLPEKERFFGMIPSSGYRGRFRLRMPSFPRRTGRESG